MAVPRPRSRSRSRARSQASTKSRSTSRSQRRGKATSKTGAGGWLAEDPEERATEVFFLKFSVGWILFFGLIVVSEVYKRLGDAGYMAIGLALAIPPFVLPAFDENVQKHVAKATPLTAQWWFKVNVWVAIVSFIGNYLWTHYFYHVLGCRYTFPIDWELNQVPICLYLITHAYFLSYYTVARILIRKLYSKTRALSSPVRFLTSWSAIAVTSYLVALGEAVTISSVPYYTYPDRFAMYVYGSAFYAIYFIVSFPMFTRLQKSATLSDVVLHSLATCMLVTMAADFYRLTLGPIVDLSKVPPLKSGVSFIG